MPGRDSVVDLMQVKDFYDGFSVRLLSDYCFGNPRAESAIAFAVRAIKSSAAEILDIGCGIGWSTQEIGRNFPNANVTGMDLSDRLLEIASKMNEYHNVRFNAVDLVTWNPSIERKYDAIVMLDVYEHIPVASRGKLHIVLSNVLADHGALVLTCPSPRHQKWLRETNPSGLQPIDEDVTRSDAEVLAQDIGGEILEFLEKSIWRPGDYNHILISRSKRAGGKVAYSPQSVEERRRCVKSQLQIRPISPGLFAPQHDGKSIVVASRTLDTYSETFIRQHIEKLPFQSKVLHGSELIECAEEGSLNRLSRFVRLKERVIRRLDPARSAKLRVRLIGEYFRRNEVSAVLGEYGTVAAQLVEPCVRANVPLVAHFHGYDAYNNEVIDANRDQYDALFQHAAAIVAVSTAMRQRLIDIGAPENKVHYISYFVDAARFEPSSRAVEEPLFLAVGRFVEKKAPHLTLLAFSKVLTQVPNARLRMIGDGHLLGSCIHLARSLRIHHAVTFEGVQNQAFVAEAMQNARCFVQHSVRARCGDAEGTPLAILEAQASGLPVVASRHTGIADVVRDGETGFLVDECDADGMAERMVEIARNAESARQLGANGRERILREFGREQTLDRLAELLRDVM